MTGVSMTAPDEVMTPSTNNLQRRPSSAKLTQRKRNEQIKSDEKSNDPSMLKWDSWNDALDAAKLDADARGSSNKSDALESDDFAAQFTKGSTKLSGKVKAEDDKFAAIRAHIRKYAHSDLPLAIQTTVITVILYYASLFTWPIIWNYACGPNSPDGGQCYAKYGLAWRLAFMILRGFCCVRGFVLFHDTCHLSFLKTPSQNRLVGRIIGALVMTPYDYWRGTHVLHHRVYGNSALYDPARTIKFTVQEYDKMPVWKKTLCRFFRDPFVFFMIAPFMLFLVVYRFMRGGMWVNLYKLVEIPLMYMIAKGGTTWLMDELIANVVAGAVGFMLFHLQHHVNISYYQPPEKHTVEEASIYGSTYMKIPFFLKWMTLGIEYHHIHHFSMRVPCYLLQKCHEEAPEGMWKDVPTLDAVGCFRGLFNSMWNPETYRYESFWPYEPILKRFIGE